MDRPESDAAEAVLLRASGNLGRSAAPTDLVRRIPDVTALRDIPRGTRVWIRADLDTPATGSALQVDPRVASVTEILAEGRARGWRMLLLAHRGTTAAGTLRGVFEHLQRETAYDAAFIVDWFDQAAADFTPEARAAFGRVGPGGLVLLENVRRYGFEMRLRGVRAPDLPRLRHELGRIAASFRKVADVYVQEAVASCNENFTTAVLPLGMRLAVLGPFARRELLDHAAPAAAATLLCCGGAKWSKLEVLQGIVERGQVEAVLAGGSLAVALLIAACPELADSRPKIPAASVEVARRVRSSVTLHGVRLVLPVDHVLGDGSVVEHLPAASWPHDVGPRTRALFSAEAAAWLAHTRSPVVYANGVMGRFEDPRWASGTRSIVATLVQLQRAGAQVYVGGGEGRAALERWASAEDVAHAFTAGGSLLRILAGRPLPFLEALAARATHGGASL